MEGILLLTKIQPKFIYHSFELPFWISNMDPAIIKSYKKQLDKQGMVNEDVYTYEFDQDMEWILKPQKINSFLSF